MDHEVSQIHRVIQMSHDQGSLQPDVLRRGAKHSWVLKQEILQPREFTTRCLTPRRLTTRGITSRGLTTRCLTSRGLTTRGIQTGVL